MVFCTYCGQSFTRDEHLERHILTHTNVKPFKCYTCYMSFARRDLLQRHYTVHGKDGTVDPPPDGNNLMPKTGGRTPIACHNCAKTKTKCDKRFPCSRCASRNLKCTSRPTRRTMKNATAPAKSINSTPPTTSMPSQHTSECIDTSAESELANFNRSNIMPERGAPPSSSNRDSPPGARSPSAERRDTSSILPNSNFVHATPVSGSLDPNLTPTVSDMDQSGYPGYALEEWPHIQMTPMFSASNRSALMVSPTLEFQTNDDLPEAMQPFKFTPEPNQNLSMQGTFPAFFPDMSDFENKYLALSEYQRETASLAITEDIDLNVVVSAQDGWSVFRCTPTLYSWQCPTTARLNLERLEQSLRNPDSWVSWKSDGEKTDPRYPDQMTILPLQVNGRDKLLAITQTFLHKALDIHKDDKTVSYLTHISSNSQHSNFVLLPPAEILENLLRSYSHSFETFFPLTAKGTLNVDDLMHRKNDKTSSLLLLFMIAQGAMALSGEAQWFASGLTEAGRISLFDVIEKNVTLASDTLVLKSALLFTVQGSWSGDKWLMDIASGQGALYCKMLRHAGILEGRESRTLSESCTNVEVIWEDWIEKEGNSRLLYSWVIADQDLSLFHDSAPSFSVKELNLPMPDSDALWRARTAAQWSATFEQVHVFASNFSFIGCGIRPNSLRQLFRLFLDDEVASQGIDLTAFHLRLLLIPLHTMVYQYQQMRNCFPDKSDLEFGFGTPIDPSNGPRLDDIHKLLQRWARLAARYPVTTPPCPMMQATIVFYHLISLNSVTDFAEIERLARHEGFDNSYDCLGWIRKRCISNFRTAIYHCGQVLRVVRSMPRNIRPPWWPGAVYRSALVLWMDSFTHHGTLTPDSGCFEAQQTSFAVDALPPDHPSITCYLAEKEGTPMLTKGDGTQITIDNPFNVLLHSIEVIQEVPMTRFAMGICNKLVKLSSICL